MSDLPTPVVNRRDLLMTGVAALVAQTAVAQEGTGPYDGPTVKFNRALSTEIPAWAFQCELTSPPVPRPTFIGTFDQID